MLPVLACGYYLYDLSQRRETSTGGGGGRAGGGRRRMRAIRRRPPLYHTAGKRCTETGEPVIRETVAETRANYHATEETWRSRSRDASPSSTLLKARDRRNLIRRVRPCRLANAALFTSGDILIRGQRSEATAKIVIGRNSADPNTCADVDGSPRCTL